MKGFPLELGTGARRQQTRIMELPGRERSVTISSAVWIQYVHQRDRRTDRHRSTSKTALTHGVARLKPSTLPNVRVHTLPCNITRNKPRQKQCNFVVKSVIFFLFYRGVHASSWWCCIVQVYCERPTDTRTALQCGGQSVIPKRIRCSIGIKRNRSEQCTPLDKNDETSRPTDSAIWNSPKLQRGARRLKRNRQDDGLDSGDRWLQMQLLLSSPQLSLSECRPR